MKRYLHCLFCDDVRQEIGNKFSFMGVYQNMMYVPNMPIEFQKLCVVFSASTMVDDPFQSVTFIAKKNDDIIAEAAYSSDALSRFLEVSNNNEQSVNGKSVMTAQAVMILPNIRIDEPCIIRVRAQTEREELKAPGLIIAIPPTNMASPSGH